MPIIRSASELVYFVHIPKCAGVSVQTYLKTVSDGRIAFLDNSYGKIDPARRWSKTSPQHIDGYSLSRLFPDSFFDSIFTIVRDPVARFESAFNFNKYVQKSIQPSMTINDFVTRIDAQSVNTLGFHDGHFMPAYRFMYPGRNTTVFKLENGLDGVKRHIDLFLFGRPLDVEIPHLNARKSHAETVDEAPLSLTSIEKLYALYAKDYEAFGYVKKDGR